MIMLCSDTGFCTEYSMTGNIIQQSAKTDCTFFKKNPCPIFYRSTEAYKCKCLICYEKKIVGVKELWKQLKFIVVKFLWYS